MSLFANARHDRLDTRAAIKINRKRNILFGAEAQTDCFCYVGALAVRLCICHHRPANKYKNVQRRRISVGVGKPPHQINFMLISSINAIDDSLQLW